MAPWSGFWDNNGLAAWLPSTSAWLTSPFVRGAVSGVGLITAIAGLVELAGVFGLRRTADVSEATPRD